MKECFYNVKEKSPLIHCITNYVTVNDVANIVLATGASPIMADDLKEVAEITSISNALVINMGTLNERTVESMIKAGKKANELSIPVIFDPVGVGSSSFRREVGERILKEVDISVITGNLSEIEYFIKGVHMDTGVDSKDMDLSNKKDLEKEISELSQKYNCVVEVTGEMDFVAYKEEVWTFSLGDPMMEKITGAGCMLTGLIGAYVGGNTDNIHKAVSMATKHMGIAGYLAAEKVKKEGLGTGSFKVLLMDYISNLDYSEIEEIGGQ